MSVRWKDKSPLVEAVGVQRIPVTNTANADKYITPAQIRTYALNGVSLAELAILDGATLSTIELNLLDASGVAALHLSGVGVQVRANSASQVKFDDGVIEPNVTNDIDLGSSGKLFKNAYVAGIAQIKTVDAEAVLASATLAYDGTPEVNNSGNLQLDNSDTRHTLSTLGGALTFTLEDGTYDGQIKYVYMLTDGGDGQILANIQGTSIVFSEVGHSATLIWDSVQSNWYMVGGTAAWTV